MEDGSGDDVGERAGRLEVSWMTAMVEMEDCWIDGIRNSLLETAILGTTGDEEGKCSSVLDGELDWAAEEKSREEMALSG